MIVAGVDIGSRTAKALIMDDSRIVSGSYLLTGPDSEETARKVLDEALRAGHLSFDRLQRVVATGYGRLNVPFAKHVTEISCIARGAHWLLPDVRTIVDVGGQDCKVIRCDAQGKITDFLMNDKCAAGTGRYLERIATTLEVPLEEIGQRSLQGTEAKDISISSFCTVFAQNDVLLMLRQGKDPNDILAVASRAITSKLVSLVRRLGVASELCVSGGVAKNIGIVERLEQSLGLRARIPFDALLVGALGGALFAKDS